MKSQNIEKSTLDVKHAIIFSSADRKILLNQYGEMPGSYSSLVLADVLVCAATLFQDCGFVSSISSL